VTEFARRIHPAMLALPLTLFAAQAALAQISPEGRNATKKSRA